MTQRSLLVFLALSLIVYGRLSSRPIVFAGGPEGGTYNRIAALVAHASRNDSAPVCAVTTQGSWENMNLLTSDTVDFALAQLDAVAKYTSLFHDDSVVAVLPLYTEYLHIVVREPFEHIDAHDLAGKRIMLGPALSGTLLTSTLLLDYLGMTPRDYSVVEARDLHRTIQLIRNDSIDVVMHVGPIGAEYVRMLIDSAGCRLLTLSASAVRRITLSDRLRMLTVTTIPANTYTGIGEDIMTISTPVVLVRRTNAVPHLTAQLVGLVANAVDSLSRPASTHLAITARVPSPPFGRVSVDAAYWPDNTDAKWYWLNIGTAVLLGAILVRMFRKYYGPILRFLRVRLIALLFIVGLVICFGSAIMIYSMEHDLNEHFSSFYETLWSILIYLTSGLENREPITAGARFFASMIIVTGSLMLAGLTGFFASTMVLSAWEKKMTQNLADHFIILNWNERAIEIIRQIHSPAAQDSKRNVIVVVSDDPRLNLRRLQQEFGRSSSHRLFEDVYFCPGDPSDERVLLDANAQDARAVIILADTSDIAFDIHNRAGESSSSMARTSSPDERSMRALFALQRVFESETPRKRHVVIELVNLENAPFVENIRPHYPCPIDAVAGGQIRTLLLAQAAIVPGLTGFYRDLLSFSDTTNEIYLVDIPDSIEGMTFAGYCAQIFAANLQDPFIPVGIQRIVDGAPLLVTNPKPTTADGSPNPYYSMRKGDKLVVIAFHPVNKNTLPV